MDIEALTDQDVPSATAGDRSALARLLVLYAPRLSKRIGQRLRFNPFADFGVEDVLQETFVDIVRGIGTFRPEDEMLFGAWLDKVADHRLAKMLQHHGREKRGGGARHTGRERTHGLHNSVRLLIDNLADPQSAAPSALAFRHELIDAVRQELESLPAGQRAAVKTYFLDDRSLESTATALVKPPGAVRGLLHRAKSAMRTALGNSSRWFQRKC